MTSHVQYFPTQYKINSICTVKNLIANELTCQERLEILKYIEAFGKCDIIGNLPVVISTQILEYFTPQELSMFRLGI